MPSIILTGHPCSGKTTFAQLLAERALVHKSCLIQSVVIINESSARPDKTQRECYSNSTEEKLTRGALKTEFDKYVKDPTKLVILDSMNYIKGFRYELHCISKSAGQKHGVIWILNREDLVKAWNHQRDSLLLSLSSSSSSSSRFYTLEMMNELMARYEPPDERNRWDRPLYRVDIHSTLKDDEFEKYGLSPFIRNGGIGSIDESFQDKYIEGEEEEGTVPDEAGIVAGHVLTKSVYNMHSLSNVLLNSSSSLVLQHSSTNVPSNGQTTTPAFHDKHSSTKSGSSSFKRFSKKNDTTKQRSVGEKDDDLIGKKANEWENGQCANVVASSCQSLQSKVELQLQSQPQPQPQVQSFASLKHPRTRKVKKLEDLIDGILDSFLLNVEPLKAGMSTTIQRSAESNLLHDVDVISQKAMDAFLAAQKSIMATGGGGGGKIVVHLGSTTAGQTRVMELKRVVQFSEIKRLRRQYVKWTSRNPPMDTTEEGISNSFLSYVENQL